MTDTRAQYERWRRRRPMFWLAIAGFALILGLEIYARSLGMGTTQALERGVVVAALAGIMGAVLLHLAGRDLRSRLDAPPVASVQAAATSLIVRPTPWQGWYYLVVPAIVVGVSIAFVWSTAGDTSASAYTAWGFLIFSLLFTAAFVGLAWLFVHNAQLELTGDSLIKTNWRQARASVSRDEVARVLRLAVDRSGTYYKGTYVTRYWIFASTTGKALLV